MWKLYFCKGFDLKRRDCNMKPLYFYNLINLDD